MKGDPKHLAAGLLAMSADSTQPHAGLVPGWPADLFSCDATEADLAMEDFDFPTNILAASANVWSPAGLG